MLTCQTRSWTGFLNNTAVVTISYNSGQGSVFNFTNFGCLDRVTVSVSGRFTDPRFDDLTL